MKDKFNAADARDLVQTCNCVSLDTVLNKILEQATKGISQILCGDLTRVAKNELSERGFKLQSLMNDSDIGDCYKITW